MSYNYGNFDNDSLKSILLNLNNFLLNEDKKNKSLKSELKTLNNQIQKDQEYLDEN